MRAWIRIDIPKVCWHNIL